MWDHVCVEEIWPPPDPREPGGIQITIYTSDGDVKTTLEETSQPRRALDSVIAHYTKLGFELVSASPLKWESEPAFTGSDAKFPTYWSHCSWGLWFKRQVQR